MLNRISRHAPEWLRDLQEYIEIWKMYELIDDADEQISHNIDQFFVDGADEEGVYRWEEAFDLPHTGTIEDRKEALLLLLQAKIPYTFRWLKNYLKIVWDDPKPHVVVHFNGDYIITFQPKKEINEQQFYEVMRRKIPANLEIEILPAPFVIDDSWLGEGVLDSAGLHLLSSGIYEPDMITKAFIGQGILESEGRDIVAKEDKQLVHENIEAIKNSISVKYETLLNHTHKGSKNYVMYDVENENMTGYLSVGGCTECDIEPFNIFPTLRGKIVMTGSSSIKDGYSRDIKLDNENETHRYWNDKHRIGTNDETFNSCLHEKEWLFTYTHFSMYQASMFLICRKCKTYFAQEQSRKQI